jgi:hypothetical protein
MEEKTQLVAVNLDCDKKNQFFNIVGMTETQIKTIENRFNKQDWLILRR